MTFTNNNIVVQLQYYRFISFNNMIVDLDVKNGRTEWKRINMRNVEHLLGVEFMHDLYKRHNPNINSVIFRHTVTIWKDGIVNSYAPENEWDNIGKTIGYKYYSLDKDLIRETKKLYSRNRIASSKLIKRLSQINLINMSNDELSVLIIDFQSIVLGDLYVLNFVQIEHGLNSAIHKVLKDTIENKAEIDSVLESLIQTEIPTRSQNEMIWLYRISVLWRFLKKIGIYSDYLARKMVWVHYKKYEFLYSAYGERPRTFDVFWDNFSKYLNNSQHKPKVYLLPRLLSKSSRQILKKMNNNKLNILIPLIVEGGIFRDTNKSLLGLSLKYRFAILDEISKRGLEDRINLNFYLLSEVVNLLNDSKKVKKELIDSRKKDGVVLTRSEDLFIYSDNDFPFITKISNTKTLHGQCASHGICSGQCKIVLKKEDSLKVNEGDIMIAVGTDFDLIEAMYRSSAVITEESGILSHAAVVCRELKKPCCIGVKNITKTLKDGQNICLDATRGNIYLD